MTLNTDQNNSSIVHVIGGSDPQLLSLHEKLESSGLNTLVLNEDQSFRNLLTTLDDVRPQSGFDEIHLYGPGKPGHQKLGRGEITVESLRTEQKLWQQLGQMGRKGSDLLLYGCNLAKGQQGRELIAKIGKLTGLDVAASDDITGLDPSTTRSDWDLEIAFGSISATPPSIAKEWTGQLDWKSQGDDSSESEANKNLLVWTECPSESSPTKQCATLTVPLDYERPEEGSVNIAMARVPATGANPIGSLFNNPGGPGGPGVALLDSISQRYSKKIKRNFHIVSWDPRGIGETTPTLQSCQQLFPVLDETGKVDWDNGLSKSRKQWRRANQACQIENSQIINHLGTRNVARDLNKMRQAVGDAELTYHGMSYGTRIGYTYAAMFPKKVRALVLDGNINPSGDFADLANSAVGADLALDFVNKHAPSVAEAFKRGNKILSRKPIDLTSGELYTRWDYRENVITLLANDGYDQVPILAEKVTKAHNGGPESGEAKETLARLKKPYNTNAGGSFSVVNSLDYSDRPSKTKQAELVKKAAAKGPLSGSLALSYATAWDGFELDPDPVPNMSLKRLQAKVANVPVVIVNATKDVYTPKFWAKEMNKVFKNKAFIQQRNTTHCIWAKGDPCVDQPIDKFVLTGKMPNSKICAWPGVKA